MSSTETTEVVITEEMNTEGVAIAKIVKARVSTFKGDIADDGWVVRLGDLMLELEDIAKQAGRKKVSSKMIKDAGIDKISSAIRCEAKWFVQNTDEARSFIAASKKGYNSVSSLKSDMAKAVKAAEKPEASTEGENESEATEGEASESETTEGEMFAQLDVPTIVVAIHALASRDGKSVEDVMSEIIDIFAETNPNRQPLIFTRKAA